MISVAIDGPAGAGKSSVAKAAAKRLHFLYVDTGALYRTIGLFLLRKGIDPASGKEVEQALPDIDLKLRHGETGQEMILNGENVTRLIRTEQVSMAASACAANPAVRAFLLGLQRELAEKYDVLMDGRDIGTVVLPQAQVKIFLTASPEERAKRRFLQLQEKGEKADYQEILEEIKQRDYQDSHRETAPLKAADDAVLMDTTQMNFEESVDHLVDLVRKKLG